MKSANKVLDILELFLNDEDELSLTELSRLSGINKTTVFRILSTLVKRGYLKRRENRGKYFLGSVYLRYSWIVKNKIQLRNIINPYLTKLSRQINESVTIAYNSGIENIFRENFETVYHPRSVCQIVPDRTYGMPLHCTSLGKIILSGSPEEALQLYFAEKKPERFTRNTITDINEMRDHLRKVKQEGVALDNEEFISGTKGVAVGLQNNQGKIIAAIGVIAPAEALPSSRIEKLIPLLKDCAGEISKETAWFE
jgi:IclR family KDG regulon transcriptional repressor